MYFVLLFFVVVNIDIIDLVVRVVLVVLVLYIVVLGPRNLTLEFGTKSCQL